MPVSASVSSPSVIRTRVLRPVWRAFYTRPNAERIAEARLRADGIEAYVPVRRVERFWSDRVKTLDEPLFRGYLFARVEERGRLRVLQDERVVRCVRIGDTFVAVREDEMTALQKMASIPERLEAVVQSRFPVGHPVTVTSGPLMGTSGEVVQHRGGPHLVVRITSIGQGVRVHLRADWLAAAPPRALAA